MKKLLAILSLLSMPLAATAENYFDLTWKEVAPPKYHNIKTEKFYLTGEGRYWSARRDLFEIRLDFCNTLDAEAKGICQAQLRERELNTNVMHQMERSEKLLKLLYFKI